MERPLRVAIADDHALFRSGLKALLHLQPDVTVVGEADSADAIGPMLDGTPCDILLLDLQMDRSTLEDIAALAARVALIVVTASERPDDGLAAISTGASGVVFKRFAVATLVEAVHAVAQGDVWLPPSLQAHITTLLRQSARVALTAREREIARHVANGLRNAEVARELFISERTVKAHLNNMFQKLGIRDRVELTLYALRTGIVGIAQPRPRS